MALLEVDRVSAGYGQFRALFDVTLSLDEGGALAIIGANGAGKSTLMRAISGLIPISSGTIRFDGVDLAPLPPHRRVALGIAHVPEGRRIFRDLTVQENLEIGAYVGRPGAWDAARVIELFPLLARIADRHADRLSGGEQQALAIGRALMSNPRVLLLDEVSLGLAPVVVKQLYESIPKIRRSGCAVVVVEQDVTQALAAADRVACLLEGRVSLEGAPSELSRDAIGEAYFGLAGREVHG